MPAFTMVDVFGSGPFSGNPLAVVHDADALDTEAMQRITRWFNLSETAFLCAPTDSAADYRVRIFTLDRELPFAGHPTLGSCHAWRAAGGQAKGEAIVQQCGLGLVEVREVDGMFAFAAPPMIRSGPVPEALIVVVAAFLTIPRAAIRAAQWIDNGPGWVGVELESAQAVLAIKAPTSYARRIEVGIVGMNPPGSAEAYEVRALFSDPRGAIIEDPITGSLNASVAQWLVGTSRVTPPYTARQGTAIGRDGRVSITRDASGQLWVGGKTVTATSGTITL